MDSLHIDTGIKRIAINDDETRVIEFNPKDVIFVERFYKTYSEIEKHLDDFKIQAKEIESEAGTDKNNLPANLEQRIGFMREVCEFCNDQIDAIFGEGTAKKVFGDVLNLEMYMQFFDGITPFIQTARTSKIVKYANGKTSRVMK